MKVRNNIASIVGGVLSSASCLFFSGCEMAGGYSESYPIYAPPYPPIIYERDYPPPVFYFPLPPHRDIIIVPPRHHLRDFPSRPFNNGPYGPHSRNYHHRR